MSAHVLSLVGVRKSFGSEVVLEDISFDVPVHTATVFIGASGSGKSTLMHILGLLDSPSSGEIILNGRNTKGMKEKELARTRNNEIGFVFQAFNLLQRTSALDNVLLPLKYSSVPKREWKDKAMKMIKLLGLEDRMNNKSNELSGGQKQRVAIARALINDPSIILADEPTGNLDSKTGDEIIKIFENLHEEGKTVLLVTHNPEIADLADRKIVIKDGEVVSQ